MLTKKEVKYENPAKGMDHCAQCIHFRGGSCDIVAGPISPVAWCKEFKMKASGKEHLKQNAQAKDKFGAKSKQKPLDQMHEHDRIVSRTTGRSREIGMGMQPGGLVPANPFASLAQAGYLHSHPEKLGAKKLAEFDRASKGLNLPKRVKK